MKTEGQRKINYEGQWRLVKEKIGNEDQVKKINPTIKANKRNLVMKTIKEKIHNKGRAKGKNLAMKISKRKNAQ